VEVVSPWYLVFVFLLFPPFSLLAPAPFVVQLAARVVAMAVALVVTFCVTTVEGLWEGEEFLGGGKCVNVAA
jgi:hypothetical protein